MFKMTREIYEERMSKLFKDRSIQYCNIRVINSSTTPTPPNNLILLTNVPCRILVNDPKVNELFNSTNGTITRTRVISYTFMIEKQYLEGKTFPNGSILSIESMMASFQMGGYFKTNIVPKSSNVLNEEGLAWTGNYDDYPVLFGDYSDGAYRNYISFTTYKATTFIG